jgi:hypothetical protein
MIRVAVAIVIGLILPARAFGQADTLGTSIATPRWAAHVSIASANALLSGVTAGLTQELRGGSFRDGFTRGALGGVVIYGGKRIASESFAGAGFLGREVAAVGTSIVRNASDGIGTFDRIVLPLGVTRLYWDRRPTHRSLLKVDAVAFGWMIYGIIEPELTFNTERSFSAGVPVFQTNGKLIDTRNEEHPAGVAQPGVIFLSDVKPWGDAFLQRTFAHERIHMLQFDQIFLTLNEPHDDRALKLLPYGRTINRWVDINLSETLVSLLSNVFETHGDRPWELEAKYMTR